MICFQICRAILKFTILIGQRANKRNFSSSKVYYFCVAPVSLPLINIQISKMFAFKCGMFSAAAQNIIILHNRACNQHQPCIKYIRVHISEIVLHVSTINNKLPAYTNTNIVVAKVQTHRSANHFLPRNFLVKFHFFENRVVLVAVVVTKDAVIFVHVMRISRVVPSTVITK